MAVDKPAKLLEFEQVWHPEYQRYCEHIYNHLIRVPLTILSKRKGNKDYQKPPLSQRVDILKNAGLVELAKGFNPMVRNAISHGTVAYADTEISYIDNLKIERVWANRFCDTFDSMVDICHAMAAALLVFVCRNLHAVEAYGWSRMPLGIRQMIVQGATSHRGFKVGSMVETQTGSDKQLNICSVCGSRARLAHLHEAFSVASSVQQFGGEAYAHVRVQVDCGALVPALVMIKGPELKELREQGFSSERLEAALGFSALWFDSPRFTHRIWNWSNILALGWKKVNREIRLNWRQQGFDLWGTRYVIREFENRSAGKVRRLHAEVVLKGDEPLTRSLIRGVLRHASKRLSRLALPAVDVDRQSAFHRLPTYVWIRLYGSDARLRSLGSGGWAERRLVASSEWIARPWFLHPPVGERMPDEVYRGIRIRYNPHLSISE